MGKIHHVVKVRRVPRLRATFLSASLSIAKRVDADLMEIELVEDGQLIYTPVEIKGESEALA
jgi:hypothetical protein